MARESIALRRPYRSNLRARQGRTDPDANHRGRRRTLLRGRVRAPLAKIAAAAECRRKPCRVRGKGRAHGDRRCRVRVGGVAGEVCSISTSAANCSPLPPLARRSTSWSTSRPRRTNNDRRAWPRRRSAAAVDSELDRYLADLTVSVTGQSRRILEVYRGRGWLRTDLPFDDSSRPPLRSAVWTSTRITHRDGWSVERYRGWLRRMLAETVYVAAQDD